MTLLQTGFRPFFAAAALLIVVVLPAWLAMLAGTVPAPRGVTGVEWHAHEMLIGYAAAVVAGFLTTAVRNWTGRPTAQGPGLAALVSLWVIGRVGAFMGSELVAAADVLFFVALAGTLAWPLWRAGSRRNAVFPLLLVALGLVDAALHLGWLDFRTATTWILDAFVVMMTVVGGRVVPMFTANALPSAGSQRHPWLDAVTLASVAAMVVFDVAMPASQAAGSAAIVAGAASLIRLTPWGTVATARVPWCGSCTSEWPF